MTKPLAPANPDQITQAILTTIHLQAALDTARKAQTPKTIVRIKQALASAEGALRHARLRANATQDLIHATDDSRKTE